MMGDGTEEQNLGQPGNPAARIKKDEVDAAFAKAQEVEGEEVTIASIPNRSGFACKGRAGSRPALSCEGMPMIVFCGDR